MKLIDTKIIGKTKLFAAAAILLASVNTASAMPPAEPLATLFLSPGEAFWEPKFKQYDHLVLTVSTPNDEVSTQNFPQGSIPFFPVGEEGTYSYELYLVPRGSVGPTKLRRGESEGPIDENGRPTRIGRLKPPQGPAGPGQGKRGLVQSGYFTVANGAPTDPDLQEAE